MKKTLLHTAVAVSFLFLSQLSVAQSPNLGTAANFVLFATTGAVSNTGISHVTGNVGTNNGSSTAFGNVDGVMHDNDGASAQCAADVLTAYGQLNAKIPTFFPAALMGGGQKLNAGIYKIATSATLNGILTLDGQNNANAEFIFQIQGAFSAAALSQVVLTNGAQACHVFWKVEGLISLATGTKMKGTMIANNSAIVTYTGVEVEGRLLSTTGAVTVAGITAALPIGCGSAVLNGPTAPNLYTNACYAFFSANGSVTNTGVSTITGDIGTNVGLSVGFAAINVTGAIHAIPDVSTARAASDLLLTYGYMNTLSADIKLLYPVQFGRNLTLTPHTYLMESACVFTDSLYLNAQGNANAVFVIKINGALSTSTYAKVLLLNGAQAKNVYWLVQGAVEINGYSEFKGTIIANNGAINFKSLCKLEGRALTTMGALATAAITTNASPVCSQTAVASLNSVESATFYPNPMSTSMILTLADASAYNSQLSIFNALGKTVVNQTISEKTTTINTNFPGGIYFYKLVGNDKTVQSGKLISE